MAKITTDFRKLFKKFKEFERETVTALQGPLKREIVKEISQGRSPVKGKSRYKKYSESYRKAIKAGRYSKWSKRVTPVNLRLSGDLMSSIVSSVSRRILRISFTDDKALLHQEGKGNLPVRKLLPGPGEKFTKTIQLMMREFVAKRAKRTFR